MPLLGFRELAQWRNPAWGGESPVANKRLSFRGMSGYKKDTENEELSDLLG